MGGGRAYGSDWILTMPVIQLDSTAHAHWDEMRVTTDYLGIAIPYHELKKYDVRRGPQWTTAVKVGSAVCEPWIDTENWFPGSELWQVRVRAGSGKFSGSSATTTPTLTVPPSHLNGDSHDAYTLGFQDSKAGCEVDEDGDLRFSFEGTEAAYESDEIDLGATALWRIAHLVHVEATDFRFKIGRTINDIAGLTIGDVVGTPAGRGLDTDYATDRDLAGIKLYDPQVTWTLEATVYDTSGNPGTYQEFTPGTYYGRYIQFKLTINRDVGADLPITDATNATPIVITTSAGHSLLTGQRVRIFGVEGNTAANGDWRSITYVSDTTFSLDDSEGDGAYTSGGTVVTDLDVRVTGLEMAYSSTSMPVGIPYFNVRDPIFGATGSGTTLDTTAILDAIAAAKAVGTGAVVYFPIGRYLVDTQFEVPNRVWLEGANSFASKIIADPSWSGAHPWMVRLGEGDGIVFNCRVHRLGIHASDVAGLGCIYSNEIQEQSGCFDVDVSGYRTWGINFESDGTAASLVGVSHILCFGSTSGHTGGIRFAGVAGQGYIKHVSVVPSGAAMGADAILVEGGDVHCDQIHMERHTDGIHYTTGSSGSIKHVYGHFTAGSIPNLIHFGSNCNVTLEDINAAGSDGNILVDDARSLTVTVAETGYIQFYSNNEIKLGPLSLGPGSQSAIVDVGFPALAGANDTVVTQDFAMQIKNKELFNCHLATQTNGYFVSISGSGVFETVRAYPIGTVVGTSDEQTLQRKTFAEHGSWNADVVMRFLDAAGDHSYEIRVADLAASRFVDMPLLAQNSTWVFLEQADQTFSQEVVFDGGAQFGVDSDHMAVDAAGDVSFVGGGGLQYGEISISGSTDVLDMTAGDPQQVPFDTNGLSNGSVVPDHTNNHITVGLAGHYQIIISMTLNSSAGIASKALITCEVNDGDHEVITHQERSLAGGGGESGAITLSGIADLAANDTVEVWIEDEDTDSDYIVENCNLSVVQKGGT